MFKTWTQFIVLLWFVVASFLIFGPAIYLLFTARDTEITQVPEYPRQSPLLPVPDFRHVLQRSYVRNRGRHTPNTLMLKQPGMIKKFRHIMIVFRA